MTDTIREQIQFLDGSKTLFYTICGGMIVFTDDPEDSSYGSLIPALTVSGPEGRLHVWCVVQSEEGGTTVPTGYQASISDGCLSIRTLEGKVVRIYGRAGWLSYGPILPGPTSLDDR